MSTTKTLTSLLALVLIAFAATSCADKGRASKTNTETNAITEDSNGENGGGRKATLELQGEPSTEFSGSCTVGDQEPEEISGQVPQTYTYTLGKRPLDCEISSEDEVQVDLTVGKNVHSVQRISGGTLNLTYIKGSISSAVSSSSGASVVQGSSSSSSSSSTETTDQTPGQTTSESREVSGFEEVELRGMGNLHIRQGESESLTVEAEDDVLPKIRTKVKDNRLIIGPKRNTTINTTKPINYELTVEDLSALEVSGSGGVEADDISTDELAVTIDGSGDVEVSGEVDSQNVEVLGSGDYKAEDLESKRAEVDVEGTGSAVVNASDELEVRVSGTGSVEYTGDPTVTQEVSGTGDVSER